jgi:hypothetical protein
MEMLDLIECFADPIRDWRSTNESATFAMPCFRDTDGSCPRQLRIARKVRISCILPRSVCSRSFSPPLQ